MPLTADNITLGDDRVTVTVTDTGYTVAGLSAEVRIEGARSGNDRT